MKRFIEFLMVDVSPDIEFRITVPEDMPVGDVAALLAPHMKKCIVSDVSVTSVPTDDSRYDECVDIVFNTTDPLNNYTEADAARIIGELKDDGWDLPPMLTPELFIQIYNALEPEDREEDE